MEDKDGVGERKDRSLILSWMSMNFRLASSPGLVLCMSGNTFAPEGKRAPQHHHHHLTSSSPTSPPPPPSSFSDQRHVGRHRQPA